jgi:hypothetical protein
VIGIFFGGIFTDALSGAIAVLIGVTSLFGGAAHYAAVLAGRTKRETERHRVRLLFRLWSRSPRPGDRLCDVIYTGPMAIRIALIAVPTAAVVGLVLLLNGLNAGAGIAVAALGLVAVAGGTSFGYFADRPPELPRSRRAHSLSRITLTEV